MQLIDFNARFYSPTLGRFIQPDSIIPDLTNSQAWNRYSYVLNLPIMYMDPSGHFPIDLPKPEPVIDIVYEDLGKGHSNIDRYHNCLGTLFSIPGCEYDGRMKQAEKELREIEEGISLDGIGWRIEFTGITGVGFDLNIDFILLENGQVDILLTPGLEGGFEGGGGFTTGALLILHTNNRSNLEGFSYTTGGDNIIGSGVEAEISTGLPYQDVNGRNHIPQVVYIGLGVGVEAGVHATFGYGISVSGLIDLLISH